MKETIKLFAVYLLILLILGNIGTSCNPEKIAAKKDSKALGRVITDPTLLDSAGRVFIKLNPCVNDSAIVYVKGDSLVFIDSFPVIDTNKTTGVITERWYITKRIKTTIKEKIIVNNNQLIDLLKQDNEKANNRLIAAQNVSIKAKEDADGYRIQRNTARIVLGVLLLILGIIAYFKLKPGVSKAVINASDLLNKAKRN